MSHSAISALRSLTALHVYKLYGTLDSPTSPYGRLGNASKATCALHDKHPIDLYDIVCLVWHTSVRHVRNID